MYVDAVTTVAIVGELNTRLVGGRVQSIVEVDEHSIGLEVYANRARHYLLVSADPQSARCHLVPGKFRRGVDHPSPLGLLLKKYVDGARLMAVGQPEDWERILYLNFSGDEGETRLIVETMDRRSNIILTVGNHILECIRRVGPQENRVRVLMPGREYIPPPPQEKARPEQVTLAMIDAALKRAPDSPAWRALVEISAGVSPLFAREVIFFASGDAEAPAFDVAANMIFAAFRQRITDVVERRWSPCVVPATHQEGYRAFAAYRLTHLDGWQPVESISEAMALYFGAPVGEEGYDAARALVQKELESAVDKLRGKLHSLNRELANADEIEMLRKQGELILAYGPTLAPGQDAFVAQYDPEGPEFEITLDPHLSYVENANARFEKYGKAKRAAEDIPRLKRRTEHELAYLEQLATDLTMAENWPEIDAIREVMQETGYWRGKKTRAPRSGRPGIRRFTAGDGFVILAGRNALQNHTLITEQSSSADLWLHARGIPGSHVIVKNDGRPIPQEVIEQAAALAAYYSAGRGDTTVPVDVTERRYVRPIKGGKPGMVTYKNERTLTVRPHLLD